MSNAIVDHVRELADLKELPVDASELEDLAELYGFYQEGIARIRSLLERERPAILPRPALEHPSPRAASPRLRALPAASFDESVAWNSENPDAALGLARKLAQDLRTSPSPTNAFITLCEPPADLDAVQGPLAGLLFGAKDNIAVRSEALTFGSGLMPAPVASYDAQIVSALRRAGAICFAKMNMGQFACSVNTSHFGDVCNPWDLARNPGGSSSGSAAAVAAGHLDFSLGTDAGGSVRIPAAFCGTVGFRPTAGSLDLHGLEGLPWTIDNFGIMAGSVGDVARVMGALDWAVETSGDRRHIRVGVLLDESMGMTSPQVREVYERAVATLPDLGLSVGEISLPGFELAPYIIALIAYAEVGAQHRRWIRDQWQSYHPEIRRLIRLGQLIDAGEYADALRALFVLRARYQSASEGLDAIALPTVPVTAPLRGEDPVIPGDDPISGLFTVIRFTALFNITGHPTITVPAGTAVDGLPVGFQLVGSYFRDIELLELAASVEESLGVSHVPPCHTDLADYGRFGVRA